MVWGRSWMPPNTMTIAEAMAATQFSRRTIQIYFDQVCLVEPKLPAVCWSCVRM
jgi:hypothetical protein